MKRTIYAVIGILAVGMLLAEGISFQKDTPGPLKPKSKPIAKSYPPGIMLTFDDDYVDDWHDAEKKLRNYNWKATFFICKYENFTSEQKQKLHHLKTMGHDIAGHGYKHLNAVKYSDQYGLKRYIDDEILPFKVAMEKDGYDIHSFAYPDGARNTALDNELLNYFDIIRGTTYGELAPQSQYCYYGGKRLIYGLGIDDDYEQFNVAYYKTLMEYAKTHGKIVIFYGHKTVVNADENLETPISALEEICKFAVDNNLKFYTVDDLKNL